MAMSRGVDRGSECEAVGRARVGIARIFQRAQDVRLTQLMIGLKIYISVAKPGGYACKVNNWITLVLDHAERKWYSLIGFQHLFTIGREATIFIFFML